MGWRERFWADWQINWSMGLAEWRGLCIVADVKAVEEKQEADKAVSELAAAGEGHGGQWAWRCSLGTGRRGAGGTGREWEDWQCM